MQNKEVYIPNEYVDTLLDLFIKYNSIYQREYEDVRIGEAPFEAMNALKFMDHMIRKAEQNESICLRRDDAKKIIWAIEDVLEAECASDKDKLLKVKEFIQTNLTNN